MRTYRLVKSAFLRVMLLPVLLASNLACSNLMIFNLSQLVPVCAGCTQGKLGIRHKPINYYEYQNFYNLTHFFSEMSKL